MTQQSTCLAEHCFCSCWLKVPVCPGQRSSVAKLEILNFEILGGSLLVRVGNIGLKGQLAGFVLRKLRMTLIKRQAETMAGTVVIASPDVAEAEPVSSCMRIYFLAAEVRHANFLCTYGLKTIWVPRLGS